jgi:multidrug efflux pump
VVVYGVMFSLLLTLYVVPIVYGYIARNTRSPEYIAHLIDRLRGGGKQAGGSKEAGANEPAPQ